MIGAVPSFLTEAQAEQIRREAEQRQLVIDFIEHAREQAADDVRARWRRVKDAAIAVLVSVLGVAMFVALLVVWGAR